MSKLVVEVCRVARIDPAPNAARLKIATVKGWRTCIKFDPETGRTQFNVGDKCVFFPPDSILPPALANALTDDPPGRLGIKQYLATLPAVDGVTPVGRRVLAARMQGYPSYGVIMNIDPAYGDDPNWEIGTDLREYFGVTKYQAPPCTEADAGPDHPLFHRYTDIESYGNFPDAFTEDDEVVFTEKLHGQNSRVGLVLAAEEGGDDTPSWTQMVGSFDVRRMEIDNRGRKSAYWLAIPEQAKELLIYVMQHLPWPVAKQSIILFGERFGMQDMKYGLPDGKLGYRAFDLAVNGSYLDFDSKVALFTRFGIESVPVLYRGKFSRALLEDYTNGPTTVGSPTGKFKGREGIVITPVRERHSPVLGDRLILKSVSVDYLKRKGASEAR